MFKRYLRVIFMSFVLIFVITIGSVYATWVYPSDHADDKSVDVDLTLEQFIYAPNEVVPGEDKDEIKENHLLLLENILNHVQYGINGGSKDVIHSYLKTDGDIVYGSQSTSGGNLKHVLADKTTAEGVQFLVHRISATEYHTYTFAVRDLGDSDVGYNVGSYIETYKTVMVYDLNAETGETEWFAPRSFKGQALVSKISNKVYSVDITTWVDL